MTPPRLPRPFAKRIGPLTRDEKALIRLYLADQPREITTDQIHALSRLLRRYPKTIREYIERAREEFAASALRYVEIHKEATEAALASGDYGTAAKAAQWALENISMEGARVIDKIDGRTRNASPVRVIIGVKLGGLPEPPNVTPDESGDMTDSD